MMPKKAILANHYNSSELKQKYKKSQDPVESRRWHLLWKVSMGWTIKDSVLAVGISYEYGKEIVKKYNDLAEEGVKNLKNKNREHRGAKQPLLSEEELKKLSQELESRPLDGGIWTGPKVARWIEKEKGIKKVWNPRGWDYLKKLRYSGQTPRPKHNKGNPIEQEEFIKSLPQKVKRLEEKHPYSEIELWFFDEHRVGLKPILRKVWSKIGKRATARVEHHYQWLYVYGFVQPKTVQTLWYLIPRVNTQWFNLVLKSFAEEAGISASKKCY